MGRCRGVTTGSETSTWIDLNTGNMKCKNYNIHKGDLTWSGVTLGPVGWFCWTSESLPKVWLRDLRHHFNLTCKFCNSHRQSETQLVPLWPLFRKNGLDIVFSKLRVHWYNNENVFTCTKATQKKHGKLNNLFYVGFNSHRKKKKNYNSSATDVTFPTAFECSIMKTPLLPGWKGKSAVLTWSLLACLLVSPRIQS